MVLEKYLDIDSYHMALPSKEMVVRYNNEKKLSVLVLGMLSLRGLSSMIKTKHNFLLYVLNFLKNL